MLIKNSNIIIKFLSCNYLHKNLNFNLSIQNLISIKMLLLFNNKNYCIFTHRYRSVYSSFKMSRYKLKDFLDSRTFSNIFVK
jgi:hypothetical protein